MRDQGDYEKSFDVLNDMLIHGFRKGYSEHYLAMTYPGNLEIQSYPIWPRSFLLQRTCHSMHLRWYLYHD